MYKNEIVIKMDGQIYKTIFLTESFQPMDVLIDYAIFMGWKDAEVISIGSLKMKSDDIFEILGL